MMPSRQKAKITCPLFAQHTVSLEIVGHLRPTLGCTMEIGESTIGSTNSASELTQDVIPEINLNIESIGTTHADIVAEIKEKLSLSEITEIVITPRTSVTLNLPMGVGPLYVYPNSVVN